MPLTYHGEDDTQAGRDRPAIEIDGEAMNRLRMWLDARKLQTVTFRLPEDGRIGFEIGFANDYVAASAFDGFDWSRAPLRLGLRVPAEPETDSLAASE